MGILRARQAVDDLLGRDVCQSGNTHDVIEDQVAVRYAPNHLGRHGKRGTRTRSAWSRQGLAILGLDGVPTRTNQDQRSARGA